MKKIIGLLALGLFIAHSGFTQQKKDPQAYTVIIDVSAIKPQPVTVYFMYMKMTPNGFTMKSDSIEVIAGKAVTRGQVAEPSLGILQTKMMGESSRFVLAPGITRIKAGKDISQIEIPGSPYQTDIEHLYNSRDAYQKNVLTPISDAYDDLIKKKDTVAAKHKYAEFTAAARHSSDMWKQYAIEHAKTSALSVFALKYASDSGLPGIDSVFNLLAPAFKKMPTALNIKNKIDQQHLISVGQPAPLFTQPDTAGKQVSLDSFKGKYVLLDFWASWCHPCREESPYLIDAYQKFHAKNFEILSVSLDGEANKNAWLKAIHDDKVSVWTHVSDLKGWKNAASTLYGINAIPQNYLLDPTGKIIASNLRGTDLEKKLAELLSNL